MPGTRMSVLRPSQQYGQSRRPFTRRDAKSTASAAKQPLTPRAFSLNHMIHDLTDLLNRTLGERVEIKKELGRDLWLVSADPSQVEASIVNLVSPHPCTRLPKQPGVFCWKRGSRPGARERYSRSPRGSFRA